MDNCLTDCTQLAEKLVLLGLLVLIVKWLPFQVVCEYVSQLAYVLQTIRISLILTGILPFVLHGQLTLVHSQLDYNSNPHLIVLALIINLAVVMAFRYVTKRRQCMSGKSRGASNWSLF